jgi:hypothetical protein
LAFPSRASSDNTEFFKAVSVVCPQILGHNLPATANLVRYGSAVIPGCEPKKRLQPFPNPGIVGLVYLSSDEGL